MTTANERAPEGGSFIVQPAFLEGDPAGCRVPVPCGGSTLQVSGKLYDQMRGEVKAVWARYTRPTVAETEVDHRPRVVWRFEEAGYAPVRVVLTAEGRVAIEERTCPDAMGAEHWIELHVGRERPWLQSLIAQFVGLLTGRPHTAEPTGPTNGTDFETVIAARQREEELKTELGIGRR